MARRKFDYKHYVDSEGVIHISGEPLAVNAGLCGDNDSVAESEDPVTCRVCAAVDAFVRNHNPARLY